MVALSKQINHYTRQTACFNANTTTLGFGESSSSRTYTMMLLDPFTLVDIERLNANNTPLTPPLLSRMHHERPKGAGRYLVGLHSTAR